MEKIEQALGELGRLPAEEQLAAIDLLIKKRHQKNYIRYFEPWKEQAEAIRKFTSDIKIFALLGGNRSGKTILGAFIAIAWALGKDYFKDEPAWEWVKDLPIPDKANNIWMVGVDFIVLRDVIWEEKLRRGRQHPPLLPEDPLVIEHISDGDFKVIFKNGSIITGKSAESGREKFQSASVDLVWIDEECEKEIFDECFVRTSDCSGKILLTLTPLTDISSGVKDPWVFDLYEDWVAGTTNLQFCQLSTLNSPYMSDEDKKDLIEKCAGSPEEGARLYGKFVQKSGLVYPTWNKSKHIIKPSEIPPDYPRIVSIDPAATGVTAAVWIAIDPRDNYIIYREYYDRDKIVSEHAKNILHLCAGEAIDWWLLDPKWGSQRNAETHKDGLTLYREALGVPIRLAQVGSDFGLQVSREYLNATVTPNTRHPKVEVFEGLPNFVFEMTHYTWDSFAKGEQKGLSKDKPRKRHDHLLNAFQYACAHRFKGKNKRYSKLTEEEQRKRVKFNSYT